MSLEVLVADCGSTGCEWRLISQGEIKSLPATAGFNPNYQSSVELTAALKDKTEFLSLQSEVNRVVFYGAGCGAEFGKHSVKQALSGFFTRAEIEVHSDLYGAAHALYSGSPVICGILGTGSNSGRYDGEKMTHCTPSLGYILGDDGSGGKIGQLLLRAYFYREMPGKISAEFAIEYDLSVDIQLEAIYRSSRPAAHLAQFAPFAAKFIDNPFIRNLVAQTQRDFLTHFICGFEDYRKISSGIVGSVAHHFREVLIEEAAALEIENLEIIQRPIGRLAEYHRKKT